jgi:hypothetical protein
MKSTNDENQEEQNLKSSKEYEAPKTIEIIEETNPLRNSDDDDDTVENDVENGEDNGFFKEDEDTDESTDEKYNEKDK